MKRKKYADINALPHEKLDVVMGLLIEGDKPAAADALKALLAEVKDVKNNEVFLLEQGMLALSRAACDLLGFVTGCPGRDVIAYYRSEYNPNTTDLAVVEFVARVFAYWLRASPQCLGEKQAEYVRGIATCLDTIKANDVAFAAQYLQLEALETPMRLGYRHAYEMITPTPKRKA